MANADAGHVGDEVSLRLSEADQAAHRAQGAAEALAARASSLGYTPDPVGADIRRAVEAAMGNQIGGVNRFVGSLDHFQDQVRAARAVQVEDDEEQGAKLDAVHQNIDRVNW